MIRGIDISMHNWDYLTWFGFVPLLKKSQFVIMKASEGGTYKDIRLDEYYSMLHESDNGRPDPERMYGFYHYARPDKGNSPKKEAENFLRLVGHHAGYCIYALDVEGKALMLSKDALDSWVAEWCSWIITKTGVKPLIYCSASQTKRFPTAAKMDCGLWVASWEKKPAKKDLKPWEFYAFWQDSTSSGWLDNDQFNGTKEQFRKYCESVS